MNAEKTIKNSLISVLAQIVTLVLQFVNRRVFIVFLDITFLGYQSLFSNVFSLLSVAELGIGSIISFHLYKEIANNNQEEIGKLMYLYKWIYRIIAIIVLILGVVTCGFIPWIVKDPLHSWSYIYQIYFLQLGSIVIGYFLSYYRTLYIANQKEYKCLQIELVVTIIIQVIQLSTLAIFKNYILYLIIQLSSSFWANLIIAYKVNNEYPFLKKKYKITQEDIKERNLVSDVKNLIIHRISSAIYSGTDNVIISAFCGIRTVALYGNYYVLQTGVQKVFIYRLLNPVQATIGNIVYTNRNREDLWKQFEMLDVFSFYFASYIGLGFLVFFQPAIQIWMGSPEYLLPDEFVIIYSLTIYLGAVWEIVYKYRSVFGDYRQDRNCMLLSAVLNVIISILLAYRFGVVGVQVGTFCAFLPIAYGRIRFVVGYYFGESVKRYLAKHVLLFCIMMIESWFIYLVTKRMPITVAGIFLRFLVWAVIPMVVNTLIYFRNSHFKDLCNYINILLSVVKSKVGSK